MSGQAAKTRDILKRIVPWALEKNANQTKYRTNYKGNRGRIGIVGGARDYSGAPYFASISAMRLGADLAYVICSSTAAQSIKNYSPDLIVTPLLDCPDEKTFQDDMDCLMKRLHALVIGPGLGRDRLSLDRALSLIDKAKARQMPLIFDADSLLLVNEDPSIIRSYPKAILTPNRVEIQRLLLALGLIDKNCDIRTLHNDKIRELVQKCSQNLQVTVLSKGLMDIIIDHEGREMLTDESSGSNRRCGGQGDITAGLAAVYAHWIDESNRSESSGPIESPLLWAAYLAASTTRDCNELAFKKHRNGMLASDMIPFIPEALDRLINHDDTSDKSHGILTSEGPKFKYEGMLTNDEISRYARQMIMNQFGPQAQIKLKNSSALIIGAGGLGCPSSVYLAAAGLGRLGIVDDDRVEVSNLHRQILHNVEKVGWLKTESIKDSLIKINPNVQVDTYSLRLGRENAVNLIKNYDMVLDATDNLKTRYMISDACVVAKKPLISGAALQMSGQLTVYNYDDDCPCFRCLFPVPPPPNAVGSCSENGVLGVVPGIIGIQQALEAIKIAAGIKPAYARKMLLYDAETGLYKHITLSGRRKDCQACGSDSILDDKLIDYDQFCGLNASCRSGTQQPSQILDDNERITVHQYRDILTSGKEHVLVDVRPLIQSNVSRLANALQLPVATLMNEPEACWSSIVKQMRDKNTNQIFVVCRKGIASQRGTRIIQDLIKEYGSSLGPIEVKDIIGGMTTWADQIDPNYKCL